MPSTTKRCILVVLSLAGVWLLASCYLLNPGYHYLASSQDGQRENAGCDEKSANATQVHEHKDYEYNNNGA